MYERTDLPLGYEEQSRVAGRFVLWNKRSDRSIKEESSTKSNHCKWPNPSHWSHIPLIPFLDTHDGVQDQNGVTQGTSVPPDGPITNPAYCPPFAVVRCHETHRHQTSGIGVILSPADRGTTS